MAIYVKKGGRVDYTCEACGKTIPQGEPHYRTGAGKFKRYHQDCLPADKVPATPEDVPVEPTDTPVELIVGEPAEPVIEGTDDEPEEVEEEIGDDDEDDEE